MSVDARRWLVPFAHRFWPSPGPGGIVDAVLSKILGVDAGDALHVTRYLDVKEVLEREDDFSCRIYDERMSTTTGPFYLGMSDPGRYERDARVLSRVVNRTDAEVAHRIAAEETRTALDAVRSTGRVDVVKDVVEKVLIRFVIRFFGTHVSDAERLLRLYQTTSKYLFAFWSDPAMRDEAVDAGATLREILGEAVAERRRAPGNGDDVLGRLVGLSNGFFDGDTGIVRSVAGLSSGAINAPLGLFVYSMKTLLSLSDPELGALRKLALAAAAGSPTARERFREYLYEAERFSVYPPFSYRYAERDTTIAKGTRREKPIPKGSTVVTWQYLGAFDEDVFERPFEFVPGRPRFRYMGFGHARHRCAGEHIGQAVLYEMALGLFTLAGIRRAPGRAGTVQTLPIRDGRYPFTFTAMFDRES